MKKVIFVSGRLGGGGSERVLTLVANQMKCDGYNVSIITFNNMPVEYDNECMVSNIHYTNDSNQIQNLRREIKKISPDAVIAFEYYVGMKTVLATRGMKMKVIVSERNDPHKLDAQPLKKHLRNILYGWADIVVCQTNDAKAYFSKKIQRKSVVICNPVRDGLPLWKGEKSHTIVNYCKLEKQKNLPLLINAFSIVKDKHPDWNLEIYGDGSEKQNLLDLIKSKGLQESVKIYPFVENIHEIAATKYMFVSSSDFEGISNSMLEAMAMGMPVVCTDCPIGGAKMIIEDGINGLLVCTEKYIELATAMEHLIQNYDIAIKVSRNAKKVKDRYALPLITKKWEMLVDYC